MFSTDWAHEARHLSRERADRRTYAASDALRVRDAGFAEMGPTITRFLERPPHLGNGWDWHRSPVLEPWRRCREALIAGDPDASLPPA
jgi:hypothetical protein